MNNLEQKIEEIKTKAIKEIEDAIKVAKKDNVKLRRWRAEKFCNYYTIDYGGDVVVQIEDSYPTDDFRYKTRNYFRTQQEAKEHLEKINIYYELMDLAEELNGDEEIDWNDSSQDKYKISYDNIYGLQSIISYKKSMVEIYCLSKDFLDIAKKRIGEERLKKLF